MQATHQAKKSLSRNGARLKDLIKSSEFVNSALLTSTSRSPNLAQWTSTPSIVARGPKGKLIRSKPKPGGTLSAIPPEGHRENVTEVAPWHTQLDTDKQLGQAIEVQHRSRACERGSLRLEKSLELTGSIRACPCSCQQHTSQVP